MRKSLPTYGTVGTVLVAAALSVWALPASGQDTSSSDAATASTRRMAERLEAIAQSSALTHPYASSIQAQSLSRVPVPTPLQERLRYRAQMARLLLYAGQSPSAATAAEGILQEALAAPSAVSVTFVSAMRELLALSYLRVATQENCTLDRATERCSLPIRQRAIHSQTDSARRAIEAYTRILQYPPDETTAINSQWLLNLAYMSLGEYPFEVPEQWLIPPETFRSDFDVTPFPDVASSLGLDVAGRKGGTVMDDFDGDGDLDIVASSAGLYPVASGENPNQLRYFRNDGDGTFSDRTLEAGFHGLVSGLNVMHADYDNDGALDLLVLRGAWLHTAHPNSLLRNNGDGTFSDVTEDAGLMVSAPTQTAAWGDYDNDGWVDLFIGNESGPNTTFPCQLFHNNGDGTFTDVAVESGVDLVGFVKGVVWGDYDNDGRLDLYVTQLLEHQPNQLFHSDGPSVDGTWIFREVAADAGVEGPPVSFPTWFFDYDNDGWLDLFVSGFSGGLADVVLERLGQPHSGQLPRLYRNNHDGTFADVTSASGLDRIMVAMGSNFGDLDNDGFPDLYLGTGDPDYRMLLPNLMFRNAGGEFFQDVTSSGGFGHLQKGHGVAFGDVDADGDQDIYVVVGGAYEGDTFPNALYLNPGHGHGWITLRLEGVASNRAAIGARITVTVETPAGDRDIHATVGSGGSFGGSSLQQEIGLGDATVIRMLTVTWPTTGKTDAYVGLALNRGFHIQEGARTATPLDLRPLPMTTSNAADGDSHPTGPSGFRQRGLDASAVGDWPEAVRQFQQAVDVTPGDAELRATLGTVLNLSGEPERARAELEGAIGLDPGLATAHYTLGTIFERAGRDDAAISHYTAAVTRDPTAAQAYLRLADALRRTGSLDASLDGYQEVEHREEARFGEIMALARLGRFAEARARVTVAIERYPRQPAFGHAMARILAAGDDDVRDGQRAFELVQTIAEHNKTAAVAETMAMTFAELGRFSEAVEWQRFAMAIAADAGRADVAQAMSANLVRYQQDQPCRTPWRDDEPEYNPGLSVEPGLLETNAPS